MRAFRHNNKKQGRPICSWPKLAYCNLYRVLYNLLYMYDLVAIGHLKLKKVRKRSANKRKMRCRARRREKTRVGSKAACPSNGVEQLMLLGPLKGLTVPSKGVEQLLLLDTFSAET